MSDGAAFGLLFNAMFDGGGDRDSSFPRSDAEDMSRGARFIPRAVTIARRKGQSVEFVTSCGPCCWYWKMPNGSCIYHYDPWTYEQIGKVNHGPNWTPEQGLAGKCPHCSNETTNGSGA